MGVRRTAHRKFIRSGHRALVTRLPLGAHVAVLGASASEIAGRIVALEDLWGEAAAQRLYDRLAGARDMLAAAAILECAISERLAVAQAPSVGTQLALDCAAMLANANVNTVAAELGVSERHLRRVFHETLGVSPKTFARLSRFHRALAAARASQRTSWADIAAASGYYDQAHLIAEFRGITGVTPQALLDELELCSIQSKHCERAACARR
jgi:AraC-like DNA-binding protein